MTAVEAKPTASAQAGMREVSLFQPTWALEVPDTSSWQVALCPEHPFELKQACNSIVEYLPRILKATESIPGEQIQTQKQLLIQNMFPGQH